MSCTGVPRSLKQVQTRLEKEKSWIQALRLFLGCTTRASGQREAEISDDRRFEELQNGEGRLGHAPLPRSGVPCLDIQVSQARDSR